MNKKYERYIDYIVNELEPPYFINMKEMYGLRPNEYELVLSKIFKQPVSISGRSDYHNRNVYGKKGKYIYFENINGGWVKSEYDDQGNQIYSINSDGYWWKSEYDDQGNQIYYENSRGEIEDNR